MKNQTPRSARSVAVRARVRRAFRQRAAAFLRQYKAAHPCVDCGETDPEVLDFDHVRGVKLFTVAAGKGGSIAALRAEIGKCQVRCANCHRRRTREREWGRATPPQFKAATEILRAVAIERATPIVRVTKAKLWSRGSPSVRGGRWRLLRLDDQCPVCLRRGSCLIHKDGRIECRSG